MDSPLYEHRFKVVLGSVLLSVVPVLVVPIGGVVYGFISDTTARLLIAGFGALGTISLVAITFLTIQHNQVLVSERRKDREKPIQKAVLREVVVPSIQSLESNRDEIKNGQVSWSEAKVSLENGGAIDRKECLRTCLQSADSAVLEYTEDEYPELIQLLRQYDSKIHQVHQFADELLRELEEPIADIRRNTAGITESDHDALVSLVMNSYGTFE